MKPTTRIVCFFMALASGPAAIARVKNPNKAMLTPNSIEFLGYFSMAGAADVAAIANELKKEKIDKINRELNRSSVGMVGLLHAAATIAGSVSPNSEAMTPNWVRLSQHRRDQAAVEIIARLILFKSLQSAAPPAFDGDWGYFVAAAEEISGNSPSAIQHYRKVERSSPFYGEARFRANRLRYLSGDVAAAFDDASILANQKVIDELKLSPSEKKDFRNRLCLFLGRVAYDLQKYGVAVKWYREVSRESELFQDALREQAWPLALAGQPGLALGAIYSSESSFFGKGLYQAEYSFLQPLIFYGLCQYDSANEKMIQFVRRHRVPMQKLAVLLNGMRKEPVSSSYRLFEDYILTKESVDSKRSDINGLIDPIARSSSVKVLISRLQSDLSRGQQSASGSSNASKSLFDAYRAILNSWTASQIGREVHRQLEATLQRYNQYLDRAELLNIEILTAMNDSRRDLSADWMEKEKSNGGSQISQTLWSRDALDYRASDLGEHWWDEVGFHIVEIPDACSRGGQKFASEVLK